MRETLASASRDSGVLAQDPPDLFDRGEIALAGMRGAHDEGRVDVLQVGAPVLHDAVGAALGGRRRRTR
jgi:hypothetical protein